MQTIQHEVAVLAYGILWKAAAQRFGTGIGGTFNDMKRSCPFKHGRKAPPHDDVAAEKAIKDFVIAMDKVTKTAAKELNKTIPNTTKKELQAIKQLSSDTVLVTKSDKGG